MAEKQELCGEHSRLELKQSFSQAVEGGGTASHVLGMNPSMAGPNIRKAKTKLE